MGNQFLGLMLLILAVSAGIYFSSHYSELVNLKIPVPVTLQPAYIAPVNPGANNEYPALVLETSRSVKILSIRSSGPYLQLELAANLAYNQLIDITGWTVQTKEGSYVIPKAQEVYSFGVEPQDIYLKQGDRVNIYSGLAQRGNFRLNKCMGYFEDRTSFIPALPKECPRFIYSEIAHLSNACQNYLNSLKICENPKGNPPVDFEDVSCHEKIDRLSYVGCVEDHRGDQDFLSAEWRIWAGDGLKILKGSYDRWIKIFDRDGNLVSEYTY